MVVTDKWSRRHHPKYLQTITFWVKVLNIPDDSRDERTIKKIGGVLGFIEEVYIQEPNRDHEGEVWIRVKMNAYGRLIFVRFIQFEDYGEPVLIHFIYEKLKKICTRCGALTHEDIQCDYQLPLPEPPQPPALAYELNQIPLLQAQHGEEGLNNEQLRDP